MNFYLKFAVDSVSILEEEQSMEQQRKEATERLFSSQGHDNLFYSEENDGVGVGDGGLVAVSNFTSILGLSTFMAACITFGFGCAIGYSSPTQSSIMEDLGLSVAEFSLFGSILSIGSLIGAAISGKITDLFGRKLAPWLLNLGRISLGFTNGISGYLAPIYIAEITTKNVRGRFTIILQLMVGWGASFMYVVGSFVHWRTLALLATIPGLLQLLLIFFIPESPRWLAKVGREKELEAALLCLRGDKADISDEATEIKNHVESLKSFSRGGIVDIFQKKYVRPLLTVVGMMVLTNLGGINAFAYYSGAIFVSAGNITDLNNLLELQKKNYENFNYIKFYFMTIERFASLSFWEAKFSIDRINVSTVVGILGTTIIDKLGRRPLLLLPHRSIILLKGTNVMTRIRISPPRHRTWPDLFHHPRDFNWWDQGSPILAFIGLLMYMGSYALGAGLPWLLVSELFPINVKGSAGSICNFMGNSTGWVVGYYFNFLTEWSSAGIFFTFSAFCCANLILIATMVPETKGRTLEEIQASITPSSD
ncbi:sugar transporter ERD6-like 15 isoform X1 [Gossypium australe]|uniref:Sugar transporter ERD6-like 15 isoform X1 n=1 Tax=Gossypium australe TaxID=47621 RepID=A0A5B6VV87_9ROSI|nr:sugar transporter ERD6-like 15 isoform X1 [Gossypium australe]